MKDKWIICAKIGFLEKGEGLYVAKGTFYVWTTNVKKAKQFRSRESALKHYYTNILTYGIGRMYIRVDRLDEVENKVKQKIL